MRFAKVAVAGTGTGRSANVAAAGSRSDRLGERRTAAPPLWCGAGVTSTIDEGGVPAGLVAGATPHGPAHHRPQPKRPGTAGLVAGAAPQAGNDAR